MVGRQLASGPSPRINVVMEQLARATSQDDLDEVYDLICWAGLRVEIDAITFDALRRVVTVDLTTTHPAEAGEYLDRFVIGDAPTVDLAVFGRRE